MEEKEEKKVVIKLKKVPLKSEREENKARRRQRFLIVIFCVFLFVAGVGVGLTAANKGQNNSTNNKFEIIKEYLKKAWLFKDDYEDLDEVLNDKAYKGMSSFTEDPYTIYMTKDELESFANNINMDYVGIGVQYYLLNDVATITRVFKDSPAEKTGLRKGDIIIQVDDVAIDEKNSHSLKEYVLGERGTIVKITVNRDGEKIAFDIKRDNVYSTAFAYAEKDYVYLNIISFGENTEDEVINYLDDYRDYEKIIIDLRNDGGGYQKAVQEIASLFLGPNKVVMYQSYSDGKIEVTNTINNRYYDNFKQIIILTNNDTASASEVLTLALKEQHPNCLIVGETTYGKGVVQSTYDLKDGSAIKITTSAWTSPNHTNINGVGIKPDYEVKLDEIFYLNSPSMLEDEIYGVDTVAASVKMSQMALKYIGYDVKRIDGYFDESFLETLNKYRSDNGIENSDVLDSNTYKMILNKVMYLYAFDDTKDLQLNKAIELLKNK